MDTVWQHGDRVDVERRAGQRGAHGLAQQINSTDKQVTVAISKAHREEVGGTGQAAADVTGHGVRLGRLGKAQVNLAGDGAEAYLRLNDVSVQRSLQAGGRKNDQMDRHRQYDRRAVD